jgi:von Willebrand factor type A domain
MRIASVLKRTVIRILAVSAVIFCTVSGLAVEARAAEGLPLIHCSDIRSWNLSRWGRKALLKSLGEKDALLLSTGGSLSASGLPSAKSRAFPARMLDAAGFDVVNIAHRDLSGGGAARALLNAIKTCKRTKFVSANISIKGATWKPYVIVKLGGRKIAFIGLSAASPALLLKGADVFPGAKVNDPQAALASAVKAVKGQADRIILLADASPVQVKSWMDKFPAIELALVSERGGAPLRIPGAPRILGAPAGGDSLAVVRGVGGKARSREVILVSPQKLSADYRKVASTYRIKESRITLGRPAKGEKFINRPLSILKSGVLAPTVLKTSNRAAVLEVTSVLLAKEFGGQKASEGKSLLVVSTRWENILKPQLVREKKLPVAYLMEKFANHLYLVMDRRTVLLAAAVKWPAQIGPGKFLLAGPGSIRTGKLIYEVSSEKIGRALHLELRLYDYAHGSMNLAFLRKAGFAKLAKPVPLTANVKNQLVEMGVYKLIRLAKLAGRKAPAGCDFAMLDFRARSCLMFDGDATVYDPKAKAGDKIRIGTVCDWKDWSRYLYLVVDGQYAVSADKQLSALPVLPRYLPDILTGSRVVFPVPVNARSLELRFSYPHAATPDKGVITPKPLSMKLFGKVPEAAAVKSLAKVQDEGLKVVFSEQQSGNQFNGLAAGQDRKWLVLKVSVTNTGKKGEFLQTDKQFQYVNADGSKLNIDPKIFGSAYGPAKLIYVPAGQCRVFKAAWRVKASETKPRVSYNGYSLAKILTLTPIAAGAGDPIASSGDPNGNKPDKPDKPDPGKPDKPIKPIKPEKPVKVAKPADQKWASGKVFSNKLFDMKIKSLSRQAVLMKQKAGKGWSYLAADLTFKRKLSDKDLKALKSRAGYSEFKPRHKMFCIVNGQRMLKSSRISSKGIFYPSYSLALKKPGVEVSGLMVWELPDGIKVKTVEIRCYDAVMGGFVAGIVSGGKPDRQKPKKLLRNQVIEVGLFGVSFHKQSRTSYKPEEGSSLVTIDLGLRSTLPGLQQHGIGKRPGAFGSPTPQLWAKARQYCQLLLDGHRVIQLSDYYTGFGYRDPYLLPDLMTRHQLTFMVPDGFKSLELECGARSSVLPGVGVIDPKAVRMLISGKVPRHPGFKPQITINDDQLLVHVTGFRLAPKMPGGTVYKKSQALLVDVAIENKSKSSLVFDIRKRLKYLTDEQKDTYKEFDSRSFTISNGRLRRHSDWMPPGGRRRFTLAWWIPKGDKKPRLKYSGILTATMLDLAAGKVHALQEGGKVLLGKTKVFHAELKPKGLAGVGLKPEQVNSAIDKGRKFLWKYLWVSQMGKGKYQLGSNRMHALICVALVHAEAHKKIPAFNDVLKNYLNNLDLKNRGAYEVGLIAMLVESYGDPNFEPLLKQATRYLLETQGRRGTFGYSPNDKPRAGVFIRAEAPERSIYHPKKVESRPLLSVQGGVPVQDPAKQKAPRRQWRRLSQWKVGDDGDNSITQFAALGLWSANRSRLNIDRNVWKHILEVTRRGQCNDGGWSYSGRSAEGYGSMSGAGLCTMAICLEHLGRKPLEDLSVQRGLRWFIKNKWKYKENLKHKANHHYYYIYSVERVGRILGIDFIGDKEWYPLGARYLVDNQDKNGSWTGGGGEGTIDATSFALLFLTKATPSFKAKAKPKDGDGFLEAGVTLPDGVRYYIILDASGSMLAEMGTRPKFSIARDAVGELVEQMSGKSQVALRVYGNRQRAIDMEGNLNKKANTDSTLEIKMGKIDQAVFAAKLKSLRARGKTPLAYSLEKARQDLQNMGVGEQKPVHVILLTDGGEDTIPRRDPVKEVVKLAAMKGVTLDIVGFDIGRKDWKKQLAAMSKAAGTHYWVASKPEVLSSRLRCAAMKAPPGYQVFDAKGKKPIASGKFGVPLKLKQGQYRFKLTWQGIDCSQNFWINTAGRTVITLDASELERRLRKKK